MQTADCRLTWLPGSLQSAVLGGSIEIRQGTGGSIKIRQGTGGSIKIRQETGGLIKNRQETGGSMETLYAVPLEDEACYLYSPSTRYAAVPYWQPSDQTDAQISADLDRPDAERSQRIFHFASMHGLANFQRVRQGTCKHRGHRNRYGN